MWNISGGRTVYYTPLITPHLSHQTRPSYDPRSLPLWTQHDYDSVLQKLAVEKTKTGLTKVRKRYDICGPLAMRRIDSLDSANSYSWEWMHVFCENIIPNLVDLFTGRFKGSI
jgi:hypothetical protein